jgi:hypothetical protein
MRNVKYLNLTFANLIAAGDCKSKAMTNEKSKMENGKCHGLATAGLPTRIVNPTSPGC